MQFFAWSDLRVVGYDGEMADLDHPNGEIVREVFYLVAETASGERFAGPVIGEGRVSDLPLDTALERAEWAYAHGIDPAEEWSPIEPAYGSRAYAEQESEIVFQERQDESAAFGRFFR